MLLYCVGGLSRPGITKLNNVLIVIKVTVTLIFLSVLKWHLFRGQMKLEPLPNWSPLGFRGATRPLSDGSPLPTPGGKTLLCNCNVRACELVFTNASLQTFDYLILYRDNSFHFSSQGFARYLYELRHPPDGYVTPY